MLSVSLQTASKIAAAHGYVLVDSKLLPKGMK